MSNQTPISVLNINKPFTQDGKKTVEIDIEGVIGGGFWGDEGKTKEELKQELKDIAAIDAEKIIVNIDSPGGLVSHGLSIHDLLASHDADIEVRINGMTASAATFVAMAGDVIKMSDNALFLIHNAHGFAMGDKNMIDSAQDDLAKIDKRIANIYSKRTKNSIDKVLGWMGNAQGMGEWWDVDEAIEKGFVSESFEPMKAAASVDVGTLKNYNLPDIPENLQKFINQKIDIMDTATIEKTEGAFDKAKQFFMNLVNPKNDDPPADPPPANDPPADPPADPPPADPPADPEDKTKKEMKAKEDEIVKLKAEKQKLQDKIDGKSVNDLDDPPAEPGASAGRPTHPVFDNIAKIWSNKLGGSN